MNHPSHDELKGFLADEFEKCHEMEIARHLDSCPGCCQAVEQIIGEKSTRAWPLRNRATEATTSADVATAHSDEGGTFQFAPQSKFELRFIFREEIARGGMGIVYRGFDREFKREVAIKVALKNQSSLSMRFAREAEISGQLQHPGVAAVYQMGQLSDGRFCIAMRLVSGQTLLSLIRDENEKQTVAANLEVFGQICQTMAYAHSKDFVHRDLKPENVMVGAFGEVQVMDWGLAKKMNAADEIGSDTEAAVTQLLNTDNAATTVVSANPGETIPGQVMGTPAYMAPEQAKGERTTKRTDVFALGGILFHILTGNAPFDESTNTRAIAKSAKANLSDAFASLELSGADQALIEIVKSCLSAEPSRRPRDAEVVNQRFSQYIIDREQGRQDSKLAEARVNERLIATQKRNRQLAWSAGAIFTALAISALAGFMYLSEKNTRIANQAKVDQKEFTRTLRDEQKIREILNAAAEHERLAQQQQPVDQADQWILARKEIEKAGAISSDRIDPELLDACEVASERISDAAERSIRVKTNHETELACLEEIRLCCEASFYTDDVKQAIDREQSIAAELSAIYSRLDVDPDSDLDSAADRIANSNLKMDLLLGLMVWQRELRKFPSENVSAADAKVKWLDELIAVSDSEPFRTKVRAVPQQNVIELAKLIELDESIASRLNVYTVVNQFSRLDTDMEEQLPYLQRAKESFPEDFLVNWFHAVGVPFGSDSRSSDSRNECALTCCTLRPGNLAALWMLGKTCVAEADYVQAVDVLEKLVSSVPCFADSHVQLAIALGKTGQTAAAIEHFGTALELEPELASVFRHRGELFENTKRFNSATSDLLKFRELRPDSSAVDELIFENYKQAGRAKDAIEALNNIIKKNPKVAKNYERLGLLYESFSRQQLQIGRLAAANRILDEAAANFIELTKLFPDFYAPYESFARYYELRHDFYNAIDSLQESVQRLPVENPTAKQLTKRMAGCARRVYELSFPDSERDDVIAMLKGVVNFIESRDPGFEELPELYIALGRIYQANGQLELAVEATETAYAAQQRTPFDAHRVEVIRLTRNPTVNKLLESFGLPSAVITNREPVRTDAALLKMHEPKAISSLAMLLMQQKSAEKSEKIIREALVHTPDSPLLKLVLAKSLAVQIADKPNDKKRAEIFAILRQLEFSDNPFQLSR